MDHELKPIVHVVSHAMSKTYSWDSDGRRLPRNIEIKSIEELLSLPVDQRLALYRGYIEEGKVFVLDPIYSKYYPVEIAEEELVMSRFRAIDHIAKLLGARKIVRRLSVCELSFRESSVSGMGSYKTVMASAELNQSNRDKWGLKLEEDREFPAVFTPEGFRKAKEFCEKHGLIHDREIARMLDERNPENQNIVKKAVYKMEMTKSVKESMDIAFSLGCVGIFKLSANTRETIGRINHMVLECHIEYD